MATWLNSIGDWNTNVNAGIFGGKNAAGVMQQASGFGKAMGGLGINANNIGGIANTIGQIGTGLLAGQNQTGVGNALQTIGGLASNIPGVGGLIGAGVGVVGGLVNAAFGSHINDEFVQQTQLGANQVGSQVFNANTNGDLLNDWQNITQMSNVSKSEVGSDGWFSNKASRKTRELNRQIDEANQRQLANFGIAAENVDTQNDLRILQNMAAYGGPINSFRKYYSFGGPFGNYFEGEGEQSNSLRSPHVDLAVSNPWLYTKLHPSKKTKKAYEPTTFAGRVSQVAGASELGQKYTDYTSSVLQQVPIVGLGISALDLGYDSNRLYHNPSLSTTKDVALDAASLLPALRKTMKGWWMKGNSGSFITEGGQVINNPRVASSLEVMLQPYRTAINTGIYAGRAADFLDDSKAYLQEMWNGSPIGKWVNSHEKGGYLSQAKALIRQNEGWREKPYKDAPKGKNWRSVGYGFNDSGFRDKYPEGISKHYEHGITKKQAEEELDYFLNKAEKQLKSIYGKQWNDFNDSQKAAILDTYYQRPASVGKSSRFYKAVTAGEDAGRYLGVAGYNKRNKVRQDIFGGDYSGYSDTESNPSALQEVTPIPVIQDLDLEGITPTQAKALELNLSAPAFDLSMFGKPSAPTVQPTTPTVGTVEDFLSSYGDFEDNLFDNGGWMDFFNAWGQAQGGNNYFGNNNWKPSDGLQTNTSNGSVQDWMGIASSVVNTVSNWGKEDPSLGRGGGYSQFGMAAYDLMKTIRDATKHRKEPMDRKLGIPIYAQGGHLFSGGGDIGAMGYAQIGTSALKLISNAKHQASLDDDIDLGKIKRSINRQGFNFSDAVANVNTNGDLLDLWKDYSEIPANLTMRDFRDKSLFDDFLNGYAASWEGFNAGQNFGPWGAAIGAVVGGLSSNIAALIGRSKAQDAADDANRRIDRANKRMVADLNYGAERVDAENDLRMLQNMDRVSNAADGGRLDVDFGLRNPFTMPNGVANPLYKAFGGGLTHGSDWDTGINWVNEGGSHGENPLGGVQMGVDAQGVPNLVEEGEAIWNGDYVFSKRMKVPKKLAKKYGLGGDMTFADAIAKLTKDSEERPLSNIDRATNDHILGEFADSQEELRMAKAQRAMDKEIQLQDDFLTGFQFGLGGHMSPLGIVPDADNISPFEKAEKLFADGGGIHIDPSKKGTFKAQASKMGMGVQEAASHILANKEDYSPAMVKKANFARNSSKWHEDGGFLFDNSFAYGGPFGNVFEGKGNKVNRLSPEESARYSQALNAAQQRSIIASLFGDDSPITRTVEKIGEVVEDPIGYFAGDQIDAIMNRVAQMSQPQMEKFFSTSLGQAVAKGVVEADKYLSSGTGDNMQKAGVNRWYKATGRMAKPVYQATVNAAKRAMAQSRQVARGQMKTPKGGGKQKVLTEASTPVQSVRQAITGNTEGLPQGWNLTRSNTPTMTTESIIQGPNVRGARFSGRTVKTNRVNTKSPTGRAAQGRGTAPDPYAGLEGTLDMRAPIGSGNFGYLPWIAGAGAGGYGIYKGIDWLSNNLETGQPEVAAASMPTSTRQAQAPASNRGNNTGGRSTQASSTTVTPAADVASTPARSTQAAATSSRSTGTRSATTAVTPNRESIVAKGIAFDPHEDDVRAAMFGDTPSFNEAIRQAIAMDGYTPEYTANDAAIINGLTPDTTEQSSSFRPKQTWTRYAPLVMSGLMGLKEMLTPADYGNADSIMEAAYQVGSPVSIGTEYLGDYRKRDPFDERYLMNLINQRGAATNRNMMNLSGGNRAAAMAGILSNDLTTQMSLAEAARQSYLANRADDAQVAEFNRGTNQFNATAQNQRNQFLAGLNSQRQQAMLSGISQGARLRQAIKDQRDAAIYGNLSNFAQGLGDIGWENSQYNMIGGLANEDVLKYLLDKDFITTYKNRLNKKNIGEG